MEQIVPWGGVAQIEERSTRQAFAPQLPVVSPERLAVGVWVFTLRRIPPEVEGDVNVFSHGAQRSP